MDEGGGWVGVVCGVSTKNIMQYMNISVRRTPLKSCMWYITLTKHTVGRGEGAWSGHTGDCWVRNENEAKVDDLISACSLTSLSINYTKANIFGSPKLFS